ncbi:hypothetical protein BH23BAC1_BH23BAC1_50090 [soil metagenome]
MIIRILILFSIIIVAACTSGKKAYQRGNYDEATLKAVNRLRGNPNNKKARATLYEAYNQSRVWHHNNVSSLIQSRDAFKWEGIADNFAQMNVLNDQIRTCPACLEVIPNPVRYTSELEDARLNAADARYEAGLNSFRNKNDRFMARQAYDHFFVADRYFPGYKDVRNLMDEAKYIATLKIVVEKIPIHSRMLVLSNEFFENKINEFLHQMPVNEFVRFYTVDEARANGIKEADQILLLQFDDFVVGQAYIKESEIEVSKDSVVVGSVMVDGVKREVYNTVKAKLRVYEKHLLSGGLLDLRIVDPRTNVVLTQEKLPGSFTWASQWASFNGDERALTEEQRKLCTLKEAPPPMPQDLFIAFTQPIYGQITAKIRDFYRRF